MDRVGSILSDVADAVTSDTFFIVLGTALTAGQYGWVAGVLGQLESVAAQEGLKAVAGAAVPVAVTLIKTGKITKPDLVKGWLGQVAFRTKLMVAIGGPQIGAQLAGQALAWFQTLVGPEAIAEIARSWDAVKATEAYARDPDAAARAFLDDQVTACRAKTAGPENPALRTICRKDMIAQATNLAAGATVFDVTDWDPRTGDPPPPVETTLTPAEALDAYYAAVRQAGTADASGPAQALAVYQAAKRNEAAAAGRAAREVAGRALIPAIGRFKPPAWATGTGAPVGGGLPDLSLYAGEGSALGQLLLAALLTAPAWGAALWLSRE